MIGLDTNVLVRYITQDDRRQSALANRLIEGLTEARPGFVSLVSIVELNWVLESAYQFSRSQFVEVITTLLSVNAIKIDRSSEISGALQRYASSQADFADCLIERRCASAGSERTMTFDKAAAKLLGMTLFR